MGLYAFLHQSFLSAYKKRQNRPFCVLGDVLLRRPADLTINLQAGVQFFKLQNYLWKEEIGKRGLNINIYSAQGKFFRKAKPTVIIFYHLLCLRKNSLSGFSKLYSRFFSLKQLSADLRLKQLQSFCEAGLGNIQLPGCLIDRL